MNYLPEFLTIALVDFLAVLSPGPAFALIVRNSLKYSQKTVFFTSLGLGLGILVQVINAVIGIGLLVSQSGAAFNVIKFIGAGYLVYIGYKSLTDKLHSLDSGISKHDDLSKLKALRMGFITNVTNPKALVFFLSLFTLVVSNSTPIEVKLFYGLVMSLIEFLWFALLGTIIAHKFIKQKIGRFQLYVEKLMGIILIALGIKIALF